MLRPPRRRWVHHVAPRLQAWVLGSAMVAGLLVVQGAGVAAAPAAHASVADCDGGTITTREAAFAYVANHPHDFVGLGDALQHLKQCGYGDTDALRASLTANNDSSMKAAGLLPSASTDINGMAVGPVLGDSSNTPTTVIRGAMWYLQQQYEDSTGGVQSRADMRDLMRAQSYASGSWKLALYYQEPTLPGKSKTDKGSMMMDAADFNDWADPTKLSATYDKAAADGTVQADLQRIVLGEVRTNWTDTSSRAEVQTRIARQVEDPRYATWLNLRPSGMYALVARDQLQTMMYGLGVLDTALGSPTTSTDPALPAQTPAAQQVLLANSLGVALNAQYSASYGSADSGAAAASSADLRQGFTDVISVMITLKGVAAVSGAAAALNSEVYLAQAAKALQALGQYDPKVAAPTLAVMNSRLQAAGLSGDQATKFATFFDAANKAGLFGVVANLAQVGAGVNALTKGETTTPIQQLAIARDALALASSSEGFLGLSKALRSGFDVSTIAALGLNTDLKTIWGATGTVGSTVTAGAAGGDAADQIASQLRLATIPDEGALPGMTASQYSAAMADTDAALAYRLQSLGASPSQALLRGMSLTTVKVFSQVTGVAGAVLDIVTAAMTLAKGGNTPGVTAIAALTLVAGTSGTAAGVLGGLDGALVLPFAVGVWALGFTVVAAVLTVVIAVLLWLVNHQAQIDADRDAAYAQWTRWAALGILRSDWNAKYDYAMYSLAPYDQSTGVLGYGKRDAPAGTSYFAYQQPEYSHFASTYVRSANTYWAYLDRSLHKGCTSDCTTSGGGSTPAGSIANVMVVGDSISNGFEGDYTWRYRLWQWSVSQSWYMRMVGPYTGTTKPGQPSFPNPPQLPGAPAAANPPLDLTGGYAKDVDDGFTTTQGYSNTGSKLGPGTKDPSSSHYAIWGRQLGQDVGTITGVMNDLGTKGEKPDVLLVELGFNDLGWLGAGSDMVGTMKQFVSNARAANPNVTLVIANVPQRTTLNGASPNLPQRTADYNAALAKAIPTWSTAQSPVVLADFNGQYGCDPSATTCASVYDGLHPNALGEYRIARAFELALNGSLGIGASVPDIPAVSTLPARVLPSPTGLVFNGTDQGVGASWKAVYGAHGYDVQWRDVDGVTPTDTSPAWQDASTGTTRWDKSWQFLSPNAPGHSYQVRVRADSGNSDDLKSPWSPVVQGDADPHLAAPPSAITTRATSTGVDVSWAPAAGANTDSVSEYAIWVWDGSATHYPMIVGAKATATSAHVDGLMAGQRYTVFMSTWNAHGEGLPGFAPAVVVGSTATPATPTGFVVTSPNGYTANYSWNAVAGASGYRVWLRKVDDPTSVSTAGDPQTATSGSWAWGYPAGVWNYEFCVSAVNGSAESAKVCQVAPRPAG